MERLLQMILVLVRYVSKIEEKSNVACVNGCLQLDMIKTKSSKCKGGTFELFALE
jgi:hypothetical protein